MIFERLLIRIIGCLSIIYTMHAYQLNMIGRACFGSAIAYIMFQTPVIWQVGDYAKGDVAWTAALFVLGCIASNDIEDCCHVSFFGSLFIVIITWFLCLEDHMHFPKSEFLVQLLENDMEPQSVEVFAPRNNKETGVFRIKGMEKKLQKQHACVTEPMLTVRDLIDRTERLYGQNIVSRTRHARDDGTLGPYEPRTYHYLFQRSKTLEEYVISQQFTKIGVFAKNCEDYAITMFAGLHSGTVLVPLYDSLGRDAVKYIINHCELRFVCSSEANLQHLLDISEDCDSLMTIAVFRDVSIPRMSPEHVNRGPHYINGIEIVPFESISTPSTEITQVEGLKPLSPDDLSYILYTSGTTGDPKGVLLTHGGFVACSSALVTTVFVDETDVHLSYLPLAHAFEICVILAGIMRGASVGWYHGNVKELTDDAKVLQPTMFIGVPRVFQRVEQVIFQQFAAKPWPIRKLCYHAVRQQILHVRKYPKSRLWLYDALVFSQVKKALGGRVRIMCTGSAPLSPAIQELIRVCFDVPIVEGYGMTETHGICNVTYGGIFGGTFDRTVGHVGPSLPCSEFKLISVPELDYYVHDTPHPRGEVLVRGLNICSGYFKNEKLASETVVGGWLYTGDIGRLNNNGTLSIIDRRKNIFKLAQGEYVAAEKLETVFLAAASVGQIFVYGNSFETHLVAVVVPDPLGLLPKVREHEAIASSDVPVLSTNLDSWLKPFDAFCKNPIYQPFLQEIILDELTSLGKAAGLSGYEFVRAIHIESNLNHLLQGFTVENDCLTPTFKLKRNAILAKYKDHISNLYAEMN